MNVIVECNHSLNRSFLPVRSSFMAPSLCAISRSVTAIIRNYPIRDYLVFKTAKNPKLIS